MLYCLCKPEKVGDKEEKMITPEYMNAKQVYEMFGISRSMLGRLADAGRVTVKRIEDEFGVLNLYLVSDIEKVINGDTI